MKRQEKQATQRPIVETRAKLLDIRNKLSHCKEGEGQERPLEDDKPSQRVNSMTFKD